MINEGSQMIDTISISRLRLRLSDASSINTYIDSLAQGGGNSSNRGTYSNRDTAVLHWATSDTCRLVPEHDVSYEWSIHTFLTTGAHFSNME